MDQSVLKADDTKVIFQQWRFVESAEVEQEKQKLREAKQELEKERRRLEKEKLEFNVTKRVEDRRMEKEKKLFEMKWKILEEELSKLADEKLQFKKQRNFYRFVEDYEEKTQSRTAQVVPGEMFFIGVASKQALKKRYKDLLKIYHPDNVGGDTETLQEINREYDKLKVQYE